MKQSAIRKRAAEISKELIREVAIQENLTIREVELILLFTYGFVAEKIREGKLKSTAITKLGRFIVKPYNLRKYEKDRTENKRGCISRDASSNERQSRGLQKEANKKRSRNQSKAVS